MTTFNTPCGRIVQGSPIMRQLIDMDTNQPKFNADGTPEMGVYMALAFPKVLPNGQRNSEFDAFFALMSQTAANAWPTLFPNGGPAYPEYTKPGSPGASTHPRFSWKYQDGDGVNASGKSVADKAGFAGHHIVKFTTSFPVRWFNEGKFASHEELQKPEDFVKCGYWVRLFGEMRSNKAEGTQVPGIVLYPNLGSLVERAEEIKGGPDAQQAFGNTPVGWRPPVSDSPIPSPGAPGAGGPPNVPAPAVAVPVPGAAPAVPVPGAAPAVPNVPVPGAAPTVPNVPVPGSPNIPTPPAVSVPTPPAAPTYNVSPQMAAQGITWDMLKAQGWTEEAALANGYITRVG